MSTKKMTTKTTKIYVGNIPESCKVDELNALFDKYGRVEECDIVKNYGFVHMSSDEETKNAIQKLNGSEFKGNKISVELSHSKVRTKPGMGGKGQCYRCGRCGHWSKECPLNFEERVRGRVGRQRHSLNGYRRVNPSSRPYDHCERFQYFRDYFDVCQRRPFPYPYDRREPTGCFRRLYSPPLFDHLFERRIRERFDPFFDDPPYHQYFPSNRESEDIY